MRQAEALDEMLDEMGRKLDAVISIEVPEEEIVKRIVYRRICKQCGAVYNLIYNPPKVNGKCDKCGGELYQRDDDKEDVVRERYRVYKEQTEPLKGYYRKTGILYEVDGTKSIEEVFNEIDSILQKISKG